MWMLITVACMSYGPDARCERHVRPSVRNLGECRAMMPAMKAHIETVVSDLDSKLIFLSVRCERGIDS